MQLTTVLVLTTSLLATIAQAYVVEMWNSKDCTGTKSRRNVYDNTCAYVNGFQSYKLIKHGGDFQILTAWSPQACAGRNTASACVSGVRSLKIGKCQRTDGGSNALSSYSNGVYCPK